MGEQYHYGQFTPEHLRAMEPGLKVYNQQMFWEAHELWEDLWMEDPADSARLIYWALIQVATALYHYRDHNLVGAQGMIVKAQDKLERAEKQKVETDVLEKALQWSYFKQLVRSLPQNPKLSDFDKLYQFKFENYL